MEADISILLKPGHFYFALTQTAIRARNLQVYSLSQEPSTPRDPRKNSLSE
jgi:hypothetical protein